MSGSVGTVSTPRASYRNPQRPPTSTALWAHLLRKDTVTLAPSSNSSGLSNPPIAPLDKTGTSMRILLHDTQSNFEQFSARVDKLYAGVAEAKGEIMMLKTLFQGEHEILNGEMVDLVNRCQSEIQRTLDHPAQADKVEELRKNLDRGLEGLNLRIDAIQMFNQTHSQALQTQSKMLQTLQEQQGTIIAGLMPLLPLLQAVPLHIESARNNINETFLKFPLTSLNVASPPTLVRHNLIRTGKRASSTIQSEGASSSPLSTRKRPRLDTEVPKRSTQSPQSNEDTPLAPFNPHAPHIHPYASQMLNRCSTLQTSPKQPQHLRLSPLSTTSLVLNHRNASFTFPNPQTPRLPLGDLMSIQSQNPFSPAPADLHPQANSAVPAHADGLSYNQTPLNFGITPSARRPPRMLRVHASISDSAAASVSSTVDSRLGDPRSTDNKFPSQAPAPSHQHQNQTQAQAFKHPSLHFRTASMMTVQTSTVPDSRTSRTPGTEIDPGIPPTLTRPASRYSSKQQPGDKLSAQHQDPTATVPQSSLPPPVNARATPSAQLKVVPPTVSSAKPMNLRERRSPFRAGRRFIPLGDDDDDDDEDE